MDTKILNEKLKHRLDKLALTENQKNSLIIELNKFSDTIIDCYLSECKKISHKT